MQPDALRPVLSVSRDEAVQNALIDYVTSEGLVPGDRLPTERVLSDRLEVSRATVREALTRWEGLGLVERLQGSGTYLKAAVSKSMLHLPITLARGNDLQSLLATLEVRRALESEAASLCAERASDAEIGIIREKLKIMEDAYRDRPGRSAEEDWHFHQAIFRASGNALFEQLISAISELFHRFWEHPLNVHDFGEASFPFHRTLFERIEARDPAGARLEVFKIISSVEDDLRRGAANLEKQKLNNDRREGP